MVASPAAIEAFRPYAAQYIVTSQDNKWNSFERVKVKSLMKDLEAYDGILVTE